MLKPLRTSISEQKKPRSEINTSKRSTTPGKPITSFTSTTHPVSSCILCKSERHPLYACSKFKALPHDKMISILKSNGICMNCLGPGHFVKQCKSLHRCKKCQKPHHSLLHLEERGDSHSTLDPVSSDPSSNAPSTGHVRSSISCNHRAQVRLLVDDMSRLSIVSGFQLPSR